MNKSEIILAIIFMLIGLLLGGFAGFLIGGLAGYDTGYFDGDYFGYEDGFREGYNYCYEEIMGPESFSNKQQFLRGT